MSRTSLLSATLVLAALSLPASVFGQTSLPARNGDVNGDGTLDISDAVYLLNWQFHNGPQPLEIFCASEPRTTEGEVFRFTGEKVGGSSWLKRDAGSITARLNVEDLAPGHAMTLWWVVFNNPEACGGGEGGCGEPDVFDPNVETDLLYADGMVVDEDGKASFTGHLQLGEATGTVNPLLGVDPVGLTNPEGAEVHLVIRSHGPIVDGQIAAQIGGYVGACVDFMDHPAIPMVAGECADILYSVHKPGS